MKEENKAVIKALNMYGRVPETWELLKEIERLNNIINKGIKYIEKHYTIKKEETIYMTEDTKELLNILKGE